MKLKHYIKIISKNKNIKYKYFIIKEFEAGLVLQGWEVKSLRFGKVNISENYILLKNNEAYLFGVNIQPLITSSTHIIYNNTRNRKLLLKQQEINLINEYVNHKGYTVVAILLYWKNIWIKIKIGIVKGKKEYDRRKEIKKREWKINKSLIIKNFNK